MSQQNSQKKGRILSGMRPTGPLHLGHLVGALGNWAKLQDEYDCFYMVADYHALMSEYRQPEIIDQATSDVVLDWLACGLDPQRRTKKDPGRPDFCNVATFYRLFAPDRYEKLEVAANCSGASWGCVECKTHMYEGLAEYLEPIQEKRRELAQSPERVEEILQDGAAKAAPVAGQTLEEVRQKCNLKGKRTL